MINMKISFHIPDPDKWEFEFPCFRCGLKTTITLGQVRREEYFICRGCHSTIKAIDHLDGVQNIKDSLTNMFR